jgi:hypothetical protein
MEQRTAQDFAARMRDLADTHYPDAERIRVELNNLSTHTAKPCMTPCRHPKRTAFFFSVWSFTTRPNTPVR